MTSYLLDTGFLYALINRSEHMDTVIVAIAERLSISTILTLDQRRFRLFRPRHCKAFDLLP